MLFDVLDWYNTPAPLLLSAPLLGLALVLLVVALSLQHRFPSAPTTSGHETMIAAATAPSTPPDLSQKGSSSDMNVLTYLLDRAFRADASFKPKSLTTPSSEISKPILVPRTNLSSSPSPRRPGGKFRRSRTTSQNKSFNQQQQQQPKVPKQPFDALLVFDVEATCIENGDFSWCNEIIEWPVVLLRWSDKTPDGRARQLVKIDEFRSYIQPTFRPILSDFCRKLTGISQDDVNEAPTFDQVLGQLKQWLVKHQLLDSKTECPLQRFMWCTDGPYDVRDFVVKQCFISGISMPHWLYSDVMDVRRSVTDWLLTREVCFDAQQAQVKSSRKSRPAYFRRPTSLNICGQLHALELGPFEGRQHCGIDDTRNIARVVVELARLGTRLEPNITIDPKRRWHWMGPRPGEIYTDYL